MDTPELKIQSRTQSRFTKQQRLLVPGEFGAVFNNPAYRASSRHLLLLAKPTDSDNSRMGLVVSKKNVGCAVKRNRIKRLCREAFRLHPKEFANIDIVVLARPGISALENSKISGLMHHLLDKLTLQQEKQATVADNN